MSIKRILVPLPASVDPASEIRMALATAKALEAHVEALCITEPIPARAFGAVQEGSYAMRTATAVRPAADLVEEREQRVRVKREQFVQACTLEGIPVLKPEEELDRLPSAAWHEAEGEYETVAVARAAAFDLMVATSSAVIAQLKDIAERALLRTQRPVLLAPERNTGTLSGTAMIAWDESLQCWHAVSAAIPFLRRAQTVEVVSVDRDAASRRASQADVLRYLRCHGIDATARVVAPDSRAVGDTLLATAVETNAGLLVMGAYAHSRLREMLLGGATRHVLRNAAATPIFMAH
jgi:nucleotide-binding universal stress UspA family protein